MSAAGAGRPLRVAVAGATGFVGRALVPRLGEHHEVIGLGRRAPSDSGEWTGQPGVRWRRCDLFSLRETEQALDGVDVAVYLVHSMMPSSRLTQGSFEDLDLLLADNFGRAAGACGVRRIVYLGGLVPHDVPAGALSRHLQSRLEAEQALAVAGVPVTSVRASLIVGRGGSSLDILVKLVERLPAMLCPAWTASQAQPIALEDVVAMLARCVEDDATLGRVCEVGGPDVLSYREMMRETARILGLRRPMLSVVFFSPGLSRLWVSLITGAPRELVSPLVQSLRHPMLVDDPWLQKRMDRPGTPFAEALAEAVRGERVARQPTARSLQRLPLPAGRDATWVAREYAVWLPRCLRPLLEVKLDGPRTRFHVRGLERPLFELTYQPERSGPSRALFEVTGGLLAGERIGQPRLEFRTTPDGAHVLAAVQDFHPKLPWWLYAWTQAWVHLFVMHGFARHLRSQPPAPGAPAADD